METGGTSVGGYLDDHRPARSNSFKDKVAQAARQRIPWVVASGGQAGATLEPSAARPDPGSRPLVGESGFRARHTPACHVDATCRRLRGTRMPVRQVIDR